MNLIALAGLITVYCIILLLTLWWVTHSLRHYLDQAVILIREQRNEDLRWHRDSLLAHLRLEEARKS